MKTLQSVGILVFTLVLLAACQGKDSLALVNLSPREFSAQLEAKGDSVLLVDVRTPQEFNSGHLRGALSLDFLGASFTADVAKLPKDKPLYIYCHSGKRSKASAPVFLKAGFKQVTNLAGGISGWQGVGLPVE